MRKASRTRMDREVERAEKQVIGLNRNDETVAKFAQFSTYIKKHIQSEKLDALAMRCWPDFFNDLGAAPCSTLSQFTEDGMVTSCESDIHGSISMFILRELAGGNAPYLGDLVHIDEEKTQLFLALRCRSIFARESFYWSNSRGAS